jgi:hypothetical protein
MGTTKVAHGINVEERMEKIKSTGYWRVNIRPIKFEKSRIKSTSRCLELVESCEVHLRGWNYPAVSEKETGSREDWVQSGDNSGVIVELWRFYQSGQFIHYFSCLEDRDRTTGEVKQNALKGLNILYMLYRVTEIFEFAVRLAQQKEVLQSGAQISIRLMGMRDRQLFFWPSYNKSEIRYYCDQDEIHIKEELSVEEIIATGRDKALDAATDILKMFHWENPPRSILAEDQRKFLERRL